MGAPGIKTGGFYNCLVCKKEFYRTPGQIRLGATKTCSKKCMGIHRSGPNSPWWGRHQTDDAKRRISQARKGKALGNQNAKNYRHTEEAKLRIAAASRRLWSEQRDKMLTALPRGEQHHYHKLPELRRHRKQFSPVQRREWAEKTCRFCNTTEHLELDHVIPIFDGGINLRENAQTLCRGCNLWKSHFVDLPRYYAALAIKGDPVRSSTS